MSFNKITQDLNSEVAQRLSVKERVIPFGIDFLDDTCYGITPNDLFLVGARSGSGKTQFCLNVARNALKHNKRVHFFALEADNAEIERRLKFEIFQDLYQKKYPAKFADYQKWSFGHYLPEDADLEAQTVEDFQKKYPADLFTFYKTGDFTVYTMVEEILKIAEDTDLIIIDHVHYFDFDDDNENRAIKIIAKTARDLVLEMGKPIILVSHIRKTNPKFDGFAPGMDDFHGSSDLYKIATRAITLGPGEYDPSGIAQTYIHVVKNRFDSSVTRFIGRVNYNFAKGSYDKGYEIGKCNQKREREFETLEAKDCPRFVRQTVLRGCLLHADNNEKRVHANVRRKSFAQSLPYSDG